MDKILLVVRHKFDGPIEVELDARTLSLEQHMGTKCTLLVTILH
jgi:hypothetical protein